MLKFRTFLLAGLALPLAAGIALAQSAQPAVPTSPAPAAASTATPSTTAATPSVTTEQGKKQLGAVKATPAEKKAVHDGKTVTGDKVSATDTTATTKHKLDKKLQDTQKTGAAAGQTDKQVAHVPADPQKPADAVTTGTAVKKQ